MLNTLREAAGAAEGVVFAFSERPALLTSLASQGFALLPDPAIVPLLPKHVHALSAARAPILLNSSTVDVFLSSNGNVAPELFRCLCPLKVGSKLVGMVALGRRESDSSYSAEDLDAVQLLSHYVALAVQNHASQTLAQRVSENLRLMASFTASMTMPWKLSPPRSMKHVNIHGHSLRVGRFAAAIGEAMGLRVELQRYVLQVICTTLAKSRSTNVCSASQQRLILMNSRKWLITLLSGTRSSATFNFPGRAFQRLFVGTTNAATDRAIPTPCIWTKFRSRFVSSHWQIPLTQ